MAYPPTSVAQPTTLSGTATTTNTEITAAAVWVSVIEFTQPKGATAGLSTKLHLTDSAGNPIRVDIPVTTGFPYTDAPPFRYAVGLKVQASANDGVKYFIQKNDA